MEKIKMLKRLNMLPKLKSAAEERQYQTELDLFQRSCIRSLSLIFPFIDILIMSFNPFDMERCSIANITSNFSILIFSFFLVWLSRTNYKYSAVTALNILVLFHYFWFTESYLQSQSFDHNFQNFLVGSYFQILQVIMIISRPKLGIYVPTLIFIELYCCFRVSNSTFLSTHHSINYHLIFFLFNVFVCWISRCEEIKLFMFKSNQVNIEKSIKNVIEAFPFAFLIMKNEKTIFYNKASEKFIDFKTPFLSNFEVLQAIQIPNQHLNNRVDSLISEESSEPFMGVNEYSIENSNLKDYLGYLRNKNRENPGVINVCYGRIPSTIGVTHQLLECKIIDVYWEDEIAQLIMISESKIFEKYLESKNDNESKDKLIANVCHDLRTPLNGITGILNLIMELVSQKEIDNLIGMASHSAKHLLFIINDLLDSSQIAKGKLRLNVESFKIEECLKSVIEFFNFQAQDKKIEVNLINKLNCQGLLRSDPNRLKQVLTNLIGNAIKFTEKGKVDVIIENNRKPLPKHTQSNKDFFLEKSYWIRVIDTGCGISEEEKEDLFNDFATINNETTKRLNKHGIGLGLSISQKIVEALNNHRKEARIKITSAVGHGSEFYFPLYSWEDDSNKSIIREEISGTFDVEISKKDIYAGLIKSQSFNFLPSKISQNRRVRILIADDDQINLIVLSHYLNKWESCMIDKCNDGLATLNKIKQSAIDNIFFDAIILDNKMPHMDGIEVTKEIKQLVKSGLIRDLAIIGASGDLDSLDGFKEAGADEYIAKPFTKIDILNILNKLLRVPRKGSN